MALSGNIAKHGLGPDYPWEAGETNCLLSYHYFRHWAKWPWIKARATILDSGAYSAWKSGKSIDLAGLIAETRSGKWDECVSLDVIGDPVASLENALFMQAQGSPAYPVFHYGDPWEILAEYRLKFPKIGLSCRFGEPPNKSLKWVEQCFARAWPHRFHSFGWVEEVMLEAFPFDTADTANWSLDPQSFGKWKFMGRPKSGRTASQFQVFSKPARTNGVNNCRADVEYYIRLQRYLEAIWKAELTTIRLTPLGLPSGITAGD